MNSNMLPIIALIVFFVSIIVFAIRMEAKHKGDFYAAGVEMGFFEVDSASMNATIPLLKSRNLKITMAMEGSAGGHKSTLFEIKLPRGKYVERQTVIAFAGSGVNMPIFKLRRKQWADRLTTAFSSDHVTFPDSSAFDEQFTVVSPDVEKARNFFTPDLQNQLLSSDRSWTLEGSGETLALYRPGKRVSPSGLRAFVDASSSMAQGFLASVPKGAAKLF